MIPTLYCKVGIIYHNTMGRLSYEKNLAKQIKVCYTYDVLSRVIQRKTIKLSDNSEVIETYSYNSAGNLCTACGNESFRYDGSNRLTSFNGKPVTYDADGNMLEASAGKFTYDSANRLITADTRYYAYDVEGTRISTQRGEDVTKFVYNVNARLSQLLIKTENNAVTKYVYGLGLIGEEVSGSFKVYHFDYRGSTVAITDSSCNITDTFEYDTYGKLKSRTGTTKTPFLYNGRDGVMYEEDTGLIYMRARYYCLTLRRFVNADKVHGDISNALTLNRYAFVNGNPANGVDPMGLSKERGGIGTSMGARFGISEAMRRRTYNEAIRRYRKLHPVGEINVEEVLKILKELAPPRRNVEKNYLPYISIETESTIHAMIYDFDFMPADENSEFGYVKFENELYPIKYFDYTHDQFVEANYTVAKCSDCRYTFGVFDATVNSNPEGLPGLNDRVIYSANGVRLQQPKIGNDVKSGAIMSGALAIVNTLDTVQGNIERDNILIKVSTDITGTDRCAYIYSEHAYFERPLKNSLPQIIDYETTGKTFYGINESGDLFNVNY